MPYKSFKYPYLHDYPPLFFFFTLSLYNNYYQCIVRAFTCKEMTYQCTCICNFEIYQSPSALKRTMVENKLLWYILKSKLHYSGKVGPCLKRQQDIWQFVSNANKLNLAINGHEFLIFAFRRLFQSTVRQVNRAQELQSCRYEVDF